QDGAKLDAGTRASYIFNSSIAGIEDADAILLVGTNPRKEAPVLNARIRKRWLEGGLSVGLVGSPADLTYKVETLGAGAQTLKEIADGSHAFAKTLKAAKRPMMILGMGALTRDDGAAVLAIAKSIADGTGMIQAAGEESEAWKGFNVLHTAASRVAGLDMGFVPGEGGKGVAAIQAGAAAGDIKLVYLLGADEIDTSGLGDAFVVYQGHHGDAGAHRADVILPGAAYTEKDGIYVNTEGRAQMGLQASFPPGEAREDWKILRALSEAARKTLPFNTIEALREALIAAHASFGAIDQVEAAEWADFGDAGDTSDAAFGQVIENFYMTDPISRCSAVMAECTETFSAKDERTGTEG
ncbi:MAG: molybdopterin-dependent oxidoreductase, partial [Alphaproteobacteria bacterium]|nr:molybdopterin-dependent oxidoreductase [Alphaproteobacteria bacterium]